MKHAYIHIPFCNSICSYCAFTKMFYNEKMVNLYLDALEQEINAVYRGEALETIYIGGGTPSCLSLGDLRRLFSIIKKFNKEKEYEFTIECNFSSIDYDKLLLFKENGVNRLSFGIETINKNCLKLLDRVENKKEIIQNISLSKKLGFNNINVDLIYAVPGESIDDLEKDIDFILSLDIPHISTYSLMIEEHTKLYINHVQEIDEDKDFEMYKYICDRLNEKYSHYEISNFGKEGFYSKHNLCYWMNKNYYGFGLAASSYIDDKRIKNTASFNNYIKGKYILEKELLSQEDKMRYEVILGFRTIFGVDKKSFMEKYNLDIYEVFDIKDLIKNKLLIDDGKKIYISSDKWYIINEILLNFMKE